MNREAAFRTPECSPLLIMCHGMVVVAEVVPARLFDPVVVDQLDQILQVMVGIDDDLILDLTRVRYISSAMLGRMVMLWLAAQKRGRCVVLSGVTGTLGEILRIAGLHQRLQMYGDVPAALAALRGQRS